MAFLQYVEYTIGTLLYRLRGYDAGVFHKSRAFSSHPTPTIPMTSPDCGASGAKLSDEYSKFGASRFPTLEWEKAGPEVKEWLLLVEDPDAPLRKPNVHGIYLFIPPHVTSITNEDLELANPNSSALEIKAGYRVGKNRRDVVYIPPRPPLGHGMHRYMFQLAGLSEKLKRDSVSAVPTKEEVESVIVGKVVGWGMWEATYEAHW
jgi:phosphatidylethanolamine-binding protein (PEBP) family uncharacterized protein